MAQLTWRELSPPDLSGSLRGVQTAGELINRALSDLQTGLSEFDASKSNAVNNQIALEIAAAQDPEAAKLLAASLAQRPDARRINAQTAALASVRPGQLIQQAAAETNLADMKLNSSQRAAQDALSSDLARGIQLQDAAGKGTLDAAGAAELATINARIAAAAGQVGSRNTLGNLGALSDAERVGLGLATGRLNNDATRLGMDRTRLDMDQTRQNMAFAAQDQSFKVEDRNDQKAGQAAFLAMSSQIIPGDRESAMAAFNDPAFARLSPGAKMYAFQQINSAVGNLFAPQQLADASGFTGSGGGSGSGTGMNVMNYQARGAGFGSVPSNIKTLGDASAYADRINAAGVPSSAMGPYQIVGNTRDGYAKKLFGANWKSMPYSVENETRIATAIFNDNKGSAQALRKQWVSLSPAEAERVRKMPTQQALAYIAQKESGASAASLFGTQAGATLRVGQDREGKSSATALINAAANSPSNPLDVVDQLRKQPRFAETNRTFLKDQLDDIVRRGNGSITYAQAGVILQDAARENNNSWGITNWVQGNSARINKAGDRINGQYITNEIERAKKGGVVGDAVREADVQSSIQTMASAQARLARAQAAYQNALSLVNTRPGVAAQLPRLKAEMDAARAGVINSTGAVERIAAPRPVATTTGQPEGGGFWEGLSGIFTIHRGNN